MLSAFSTAAKFAAIENAEMGEDQIPAVADQQVMRGSRSIEL
jgi:hypothetical protein